MKKTNNGLFVLVPFVMAILMAIFAAFGAFYTVDEGERAVVKRYGEVVDVTGPGLHFKMPFITDVESVSVQSFVRRYGAGEGGMMQAYSQDMQVADLIVSVNFTPNPDHSAVRDVIVKYGSLEGYLRRDVDPKVYQTVKAVFAKYTAQSSNENQVQLAAAILENLQKAIPNSVVTIQSTQIEDISFSSKFESAMEERKMNEIAVEKQKQENLKVLEQNKQTVDTAKADADAKRAAADAEAYRTEQQAKAEAGAIKIRGEAEADAIRAKAKALADNPSLVELTKAERWDGVLPTSMVPGSAVPFINVK